MPGPGRVEGSPPRPERRAPTHTLVFEVPLWIEEGRTLYFDPIQDALAVLLSISRLVSSGVLCGDPRASITEHGVENGGGAGGGAE